MKTLPTFIIDGLLESSKTTFIINTIKTDDFYKKNRTLVLACEDGEIQYSDEFKSKYNTDVVFFDSIDDFTTDKINAAVANYKPARVVIELNGMWDINRVALPEYLKVYQFIYFINYDTFPVYFPNMRQQFLDAVKQADVVVFINAFEKTSELQQYSASFKLTNANANYMVMNNKGQLMDAFEVELPYDVNAPIIKLNDDDYGIWYIDTFDHREKYVDKIMEFNAMVFLAPQLPKDTFIAGRLAMTCCSNDVQLYGHLCMNNEKLKLKDKSFVHIVAKVKVEFSEEYQEDEIVLYPESIKVIEPLKDPVLDLTK